MGAKHRIAFLQDTVEIGYRELVTILRNLDRTQFEPVLIVPGKGPLLEAIADLRIPTYIMYLPAWRKLRDLPFCLTAVYRLCRLLRNQRVDLVFCHGMWEVPLSCFACGLMELPMVCRIGAILPLQDKKRVRQYRLRCPERLIMISKAVAESFAAAGAPREKMQVIYPGVDIFSANEFDRGAVRKSLGLSPDGEVIGCVARLDPAKGHYSLFRALLLIRKELPSVKCMLVGDEPNKLWRETVQGWVRELELTECVLFTGWQDNVFPYLGAMDVFVFPTLQEAFGIALIEAMAMELSVVGSKVGGVSEVVNEAETGFLVPPNDHEAIAERVLRLLKDEGLRKRMGVAGRKRAAEHFSAEIMTRSMEQSFLEVMKE